MSEVSSTQGWLTFGGLVIALLTTASGWTLAFQASPTSPAEGTSRALFCAFGGVGLRPLKPPPDVQFAVAVVEIVSSSDIPNAAVSDFALHDRAGTVTRFTRVVEIEEFNRVRSATEGSFAYYLNSGGTRPWNGTLRAGIMRLRVRVALGEEPRAPVFPMTFRLTIGSHVIEGPVDGMWPT